MIYWGPGLLAVVWFGTTIPPPLVSNLSLFLSSFCVSPVEPTDGRGGREGGGGGAKSYNDEKAWPSVNLSILSDARESNASSPHDCFYSGLLCIYRIRMHYLFLLIRAFLFNDKAVKLCYILCEKSLKSPWIPGLLINGFRLWIICGSIVGSDSLLDFCMKKNITIQNRCGSILKRSPDPQSTYI